MTRRHRAQHRAASNPGPCCDRCHHRLVRRSQPARVIHRHDRLAGDRAGEHHRAVGDGQDRSPFFCGEVDTAVPGQPIVLRTVERGHDVRLRPQRPGELTRYGRRHRSRERQRGRDADRDCLQNPCDVHSTTISRNRAAKRTRTPIVDKRFFCPQAAESLDSRPWLWRGSRQVYTRRCGLCVHGSTSRVRVIASTASAEPPIREPVVGGPEIFVMSGPATSAAARAEVTDTLRQPHHRKRVLQPWL